MEKSEVVRLVDNGLSDQKCFELANKENSIFIAHIEIPISGFKTAWKGGEWAAEYTENTSLLKSLTEEEQIETNRLLSEYVRILVDASRREIYNKLSK